MIGSDIKCSFCGLAACDVSHEIKRVCETEKQADKCIHGPDKKKPR